MQERKTRQCHGRTAQLSTLEVIIANCKSKVSANFIAATTTFSLYGKKKKKTECHQFTSQADFSTFYRNTSLSCELISI